MSNTTEIIEKKYDVTIQDDKYITVEVGVQGPPGPTGPAGTGAGFTWLGAWDIGTAYDLNNSIEYNGSTYVAIQTGTGQQPDISPSFWDLSASKGDQGIQGIQGPAGVDGVGQIWQGAWLVGTTYVTNDGVEYNGSSYIALQVSTGSQPDTNPADWDLYASVGATGADGVSDHLLLSNIGNNTHPQIDSHITNTAAHGVAEVLGATENQTVANKTVDGLNNTITNVESSFSVRTLARKSTAGTISKGNPVYVVGYNIGGGYIEVEEADASDPAKMPAIGLAAEDVTNTNTVHVTSIGEIIDVDTDALATGTNYYVASGGGLTTTQPIGPALIQKIGKVHRQSVLNGIIYVSGANRANALPNIAQDNIWQGDSNGVAQEITTNTAFNLALGTLVGQVAEGNHLHAGVYSLIGHNHDADYADIAHIHAINDLSDVNASPTEDQVLAWDNTGGNWVARDRVDNDAAAIWGNITGTLSNQSDLQSALDGKEPADGTILKDVDIGINVQAYDTDLTNIAALTGTSGFLKTDGANVWTVDISTYLTSFTELNDLTNNVTWVNVPAANITETSVTQHQAALSIAATQITGETWISDITGESIKDLSDVFTAMAPNDGDVLTYDTTNGWQSEVPSGGGVTDHTLLTNIGTNTHAQIDTHISAISPHNNWMQVNNGANWGVDPIASHAINCLAIGSAATANTSSATAIGRSATCSGGESFAIGTFATVNTGAANSVALGYATTLSASTTHSVALGSIVTNNVSNSVRMGYSTTNIMHLKDTGTLTLEGAKAQFVMPSYTVAGVPTGVTGGMIFVTDETGGSIPAFYDGTNWRRVTDRAVVS